MVSGVVEKVLCVGGGISGSAGAFGVFFWGFEDGYAFL